MKNLLNIKQINLIYIVYIILLIAFIHIHTPDTYFSDSFNTFQKKCFKQCSSNTCKYVSKKRGINYYIGHTDEKDIKRNNNCFLTFWNLSHFFFYGLLSFIAPFYINKLIIISTLFEFYEYIYLDCHDYWDIFMNMVGLYTGKHLNLYFINN